MCQSFYPALRVAVWVELRGAGMERGADPMRLCGQRSRSVASTTLVLLGRFCSV
jgi:hypothetical protein